MLSPVTRIAALGVLLCAAAAQAQHVKAPPLPPGANLVRVEPGLNPAEKKRSERAHHHKGHVKKDMTKDDSVAKGGNGNTNPGAKK